MNSPQQVFSPQFAALQNQYNQLQEIYNQINAGKALPVHDGGPSRTGQYHFDQAGP